jgi:CMP-N,N'-diacetyllegionaminic acid synthase
MVTLSDPASADASTLAAPLLIIVPIRGNSKRLPDKHARHLLGETLLQRTARHITDAGLMSMVLLTTDSESIAAAGQSLGWSAPFLRPAALADDSAKTVDAALHALDWFRQDRGLDPEITLLVQVTSPLRRPMRLSAAVEMLRNHRSYDAVVGVCEAAPSDEYLMVTAGDAIVPIDTNGEGPVYRLNGAVYAIRTEALRLHRTFVPPNTRPLVMPSVESVDVDDMDDWWLAEAILRQGLV